MTLPQRPRPPLPQRRPRRLLHPTIRVLLLTIRARPLTTARRPLPPHPPHPTTRAPHPTTRAPHLTTPLPLRRLPPPLPQPRAQLRTIRMPPRATRTQIPSTRISINGFSARKLPTRRSTTRAPRSRRARSISTLRRVTCACGTAPPGKFRTTPPPAPSTALTVEPARSLHNLATTRLAKSPASETRQRRTSARPPVPSRPATTRASPVPRKRRTTFRILHRI